jgi:hypothetical protein
METTTFDLGTISRAFLFSFVSYPCQWFHFLAPRTDKIEMRSPTTAGALSCAVQYEQEYTNVATATKLSKEKFFIQLCFSKNLE